MGKGLGKMWVGFLYGRHDTVDGRIPAPPGMVKTLSRMG